MAWTYLIIASLFEVGWAAGLKYCDGLKFNFAICFTFVSMIASMLFLWLSTQTIPLNIAYAVWGGLGMVGVVLYDAIFFKEHLSLGNIFFLLLILIGIVGLKITTK